MLPPNTGSIFRLLDDGGKKTSVIAAVAFSIGYWLGKNDKYKGYDRQHHEGQYNHDQRPYDRHTEQEHDRNHKHGEHPER